jgi:hypothetical protein
MLRVTEFNQIEKLQEWKGAQNAIFVVLPVSLFLKFVYCIQTWGANRTIYITLQRDNSLAIH